MNTQQSWILVLTVATAVTAAAKDRPAKRPEAPADSGGRLERLLSARPEVNGPLALEQAVATALRESPVVRGAVEEVEAARGRLEAARAERRPWVSASTFLSGGSNPNIVAAPDPVQPQMIMGVTRDLFFDANLMVMYPLFTSGRLEAMVRQARAMREASRADLEAQRQEVAFLTRSAYREVQARRAVVTVWQQKLQEDEERLREDRARLREGQIPSLYVLRDEAEVAASRQELTNAVRDVELSLVQLRTVMGVSTSSSLEVTGGLEFQPVADFLKELGLAEDAPEAPRALTAELAGLLRLAEQRRPELRAADQRIRSARAETATVRGGYRPQINLFAMGDLMKMKGEDPFVGSTYGVAASVPLYNGGQRRARLQTAEAARRREEAELERLALQVAQEVNTGLLNLRAAEQNIRTAQAALASAREEYRVARLRYGAGYSVFVEVLDALTARTRAESNVVQALYQFNVARDRLRRAVGETPGTPEGRSGERSAPTPARSPAPGPGGSGG